LVKESRETDDLFSPLRTRGRKDVKGLKFSWHAEKGVADRELGVGWGGGKVPEGLGLTHSKPHCIGSRDWEIEIGRGRGKVGNQRTWKRGGFLQKAPAPQLESREEGLHSGGEGWRNGVRGSEAGLSERRAGRAQGSRGRAFCYQGKGRALYEENHYYVKTNPQ